MMAIRGRSLADRVVAGWAPARVSKRNGSAAAVAAPKVWRRVSLTRALYPRPGPPLPRRGRARRFWTDANDAIESPVHPRKPSGSVRSAPASAAAEVAQWQSTAFVKRGLRVQIPPSAFPLLHQCSDVPGRDAGSRQVTALFVTASRSNDANLPARCHTSANPAIMAALSVQ